MEQQQLLKLGDQLNCTVMQSSGGRRFLVRSTSAPRGWKLELHSRQPERIKEGDHGTFWVAKIAPLQREVLLHDGDYGRLPVSDAMRPRYVAALRALLGEEPATGENLADARNMLVQIGKQQQADWLTVWRILGEPAPGEVKVMLARVEAMRTARKEAPESVGELQGLMEADFGPRLREALGRLTA